MCLYEDLIAQNRPAYESGLGILKDRIDHASLFKDLPVIELLSFDIMSIAEHVDLKMEEDNIYLFEDQRTSQKIIFRFGNFLKTPHHILINFVKSSFFVRNVSPEDWKSSKIEKWEFTDPLNDIGLVFSFYNTEEDDLFMVVVPFGSMVFEDRSLAA